MKYLIAFLVLSYSFAANSQDGNGCDPTKVGEVIDEEVVHNLESISIVTKRQFPAKEINSLCESFRKTCSPSMFEYVTNDFIKRARISREEFFSETMFNLVCPTGDEHFLHFVMRNSPLDFERFLEQEGISYPKDIPREYIKGQKLTLLDMLNTPAFRDIYGGRIFKFRGIIKKLNDEGACISNHSAQ